MGSRVHSVRRTHVATDAELLGRIASLESALSRGVRQVQFDGRMTTYASVNEISAAIDRLRGELAASQGTRPKQYMATGVKGLCG